MGLITLAAIGATGLAAGAAAGALANTALTAPKKQTLAPAGGGVFGNLTGGFGLLGGQVSPTYAPVTTHAPQTTTTSTFAPAQSYAYSPQVQYAPQVSVGSPGSVQESKKEQSSRIDQEATARPAVTVQPAQEFPITSAAGQQQTDFITPIIILGVVAGGAYILTRKKGKR
jgi:hypothetical protein